MHIVMTHKQETEAHATRVSEKFEKATITGHKSASFDLCLMKTQVEMFSINIKTQR